jgi:hypothetical protein
VLSYLDNLARPGVQVLVMSHSPTTWDKQVNELKCGCCLAASDNYSPSHQGQ